MPQFVIEARPYQDPDVVRMVAEVQAHYTDIYGAPDHAAVEIDEFVPPRGVLLVGFLDGAAVAMGGWRRMPDTGGLATAEIKRMYTSPTVRRLGLGRRMLAAVEADAAAAGVELLVLNTGPYQQPAVALYEAAGYRPSEPFGYYAEHGEALFYSKPASEPANRTRDNTPDSTLPASTGRDGR